MRVFANAMRKAQLLLFEMNSPAAEVEAPVEDPRPEMLCFRGQALALVRHFFEISSQVGRLPSLLGREFFRARVSHHAVPSFEEQIIFVRDVEMCLEKLDDEHAQIVDLVGLYDFSHDEVAEMLHCPRSSVSRLFAEALDTLSELFLQARLLSEQRPDRRQRQMIDRPLPAYVGAPGRKPPRSVKVCGQSGRDAAQLYEARA
jgi:DNA-directed RNA polymerase specialized sigma24 family protein